jgi:hypothetical protein
MKTFGMIAAGLLITIGAQADTISSTGILLPVPANFQSQTGFGVQFWNNSSIEGSNMNVGDYLTGSNPFMGATDYLGTAGNFGDYLSADGTAAPSFSFVQSAVTVQARLLFSYSQANDTYDYPGFAGTQIGLYNVANPAQNVTLFASGTLYNQNDPNGILNNNVTPQTPVTAGTWANYGIYASTCWFTPIGDPSCNTFYSGANLQQFSLFENPQSPNTFYVGFEDGVYGSKDYNDVIFQLQTTQNQTQIFTGSDDGPPAPVVPEPSTWSILGLGLAGLVVFKRLKRSRV